jgi:diaminobutyrate-2-oxoglutarate transaminase
MTCCFEKGLVLERVGRDNAVMKIMPPLTIDTDTLLKGLTILKEVIKEQIEVKA